MYLSIQSKYMYLNPNY